MLEKLPPEVLIYIQNVRKYFTTNEESKEYFQIDKHGEEFFNEITDLSQKNFEEHGTAELSIEQFEDLRRKVMPNFTIHSKFVTLEELGKFGLISLN